MRIEEEEEEEEERERESVYVLLYRVVSFPTPETQIKHLSCMMYVCFCLIAGCHVLTQVYGADDTFGSACWSSDESKFVYSAHSLITVAKSPIEAEPA